MKKIALIFYLLLPVMFITGSSQNAISGKITIKENGKPLPGVIVHFPDLRQGTVTNAEGIYRIGNLPSGIFLIEIKSLGYKTLISSLHISGQVHYDVLLEEAAVEMNEVVVTGSVASTQKLLNPIPVLSVSNFELQRNLSVNLIDGLSRVPGISQISTGNAVSKPVIRGLGYNRVLVLHDDIRQEGQQWGDEHGVEIDANSIGKVEIVKGPGSLIYGSDALAGVLNFISAPPLPEGKIESNFEAQYQSNSRLMDYSLNNSGNLNGVNWVMRGSWKMAGNFRNRMDDVVYNSGYNERNLNGYVGLTKKWGYSFLRFSTFNQKLGLIEGERDADGDFLSSDGLKVTKQMLNSYNLDIPRQNVHHNRVQINSKILMGNGSIQSDFGFQNNIRKEFADAEAPDETELHFLLNTFSYEIKYNFPYTSGWRSIAGLSGMLQKNSNKGEEQLIPDYHLSDIGLFFITRKTWEELHFSAGIRADNRIVNSETMQKEETLQPPFSTNLKFEGFKKQFNNISFGAGISKSVSDFIFKLNYAKGFRAPNLAELATNGKHEGTFRYEYGNKYLKSEVSHNLDAGVIYKTHHVALEVNAFVNRVRNFIYLNKLVSVYGGDSIPDEDEPSPAFKFNQGNAVLYGGEISLDIHPHPFDYLHLQQSFSMVEGTLMNQSDSTRYLPFIPAPQYRAEIRIQPINIKSLHNPYLSLEYRYSFRKDHIFNAFGTETPTGSYGIVNFGMGTEIRTKKKETMMVIHFQILNLMDEVYQNHLSRLKYAPENPLTGRVGIYNPGRSINLRIEVPVRMKS